MEFKDNSSFSKVYDSMVICTEGNSDGAFRDVLTWPNKTVVLNWEFMVPVIKNWLSFEKKKNISVLSMSKT